LNTASTALGLRARPQPPGTEFLDAETKRQKSPLKSANTRRDQNPGTEWSEITAETPAETPYWAPYRKPAVCEDWMVECAVRYELVSKIDENVGWAPEYIASIKEMAETSRTASTPILTSKISAL